MGCSEERLCRLRVLGGMWVAAARRKSAEGRTDAAGRPCAPGSFLGVGAFGASSAVNRRVGIGSSGKRDSEESVYAGSSSQ